MLRCDRRTKGPPHLGGSGAPSVSTFRTLWVFSTSLSFSVGSVQESLFGERTQLGALVLQLAVVRVQAVCTDVVDDVVGQQVLDTEAPAERAAHLGGAGLVSDPLSHQEDVCAVPGEEVRLVHGPVRLLAPAAHTHQAEAACHLLHVLVAPQTRHAE